MTKASTPRRMLTVLVTVVMMFSLFSTTVFAASNAKFTWYQTKPWISTTQTISGSARVTFEGVATSPNAGTFKVKLQRQGLFGIWSNVGNVYTVRQHSDSTYNTRTGKYVNGQYFKLYWSSVGSGTYRFVLEDASAPQTTVITQAYYW